MSYAHNVKVMLKHRFSHTTYSFYIYICNAFQKNLAKQKNEDSLNILRRLNQIKQDDTDRNSEM